jgi:hypothetical protein
MAALGQFQTKCIAANKSNPDSSFGPNSDIPSMNAAPEKTRASGLNYFRLTRALGSQGGMSIRSSQLLSLPAH